jgi:hypothetical protein
VTIESWLRRGTGVRNGDGIATGHDGYCESRPKCGRNRWIFALSWQLGALVIFFAGYIRDFFPNVFMNLFTSGWDGGVSRWNRGR